MKKLYAVILIACLFLVVALPRLHAAVDGVSEILPSDKVNEIQQSPSRQLQQDTQEDESEDESIKKREKKDLKKKRDTQKKPKNPRTNSE